MTKSHKREITMSANNKPMLLVAWVWAVLSCFLFVQSAVSMTEDEKNNITVYEKVADGVVNVTSIALQMDFFLNAVPAQGSGSGSILDARGHILTNHHVVANAKNLEVTLADESKWPAKLIGSDPDNDLAVIKIEAPREKLKAITMGVSKNLSS